MAPCGTRGYRSPRELVLARGTGALSDTELLSVVLGEDGPGPISAAVLREHPIPDGLWRVGPDDLLRYAGVGPAAAARVLAALELGRRAPGWRAGARPPVAGPDDVVALCGPMLRGRDREHFLALVLNTKNRLVRTIEVSVGSLSASIVHPRELFKEAVKASAASVVVVHNHPSGDPTPSGADIQLTRRLVKAGDVLGIEVLDHVILADGGAYSSLRDAGLM